MTWRAAFGWGVVLVVRVVSIATALWALRSVPGSTSTCLSGRFSDFQTHLRLTAIPAGREFDSEEREIRMNHYGTPRADAIDLLTAMAALEMDEATLLSSLQPGELIVVGPHKRAITRAAAERISPGSTTGIFPTRAQNVVAINDSQRW